MDPALAREVEDLGRNRIINETIALGDSDIQRFYDGAVVFVTGGTGFIGKSLIEKLLRSCNIKKIYMLIRPKKQYSPADRIKKLGEDMVFDTLRKLKPKFTEKISAVNGDITELGLGISQGDMTRLTEEVNIVFHVAATIQFTEPLKKATITNVRGTREALNLGLACKNLKSFIHVSTAFSHATYSRIDKPVLDKFYPSPVPPHTMIELVETLDEAKLNNITEDLIKGWPNTYAFTKAIAEELVRNMSGKMPVTVVRPAIVMGSYHEPAPGWFDMNCVYGPCGVYLGVGLGVLQVGYIDKETALDFVPVDFVNNATIAAGKVAADKWTQNDTDIEVYTVATKRNRVTNGEFSNLMKEEYLTMPSDKSVWYSLQLLTSNKLLYSVLFWYLHLIPGYLIDCVLRLLGKTPQAVKIFTKVYKINCVLTYFAFNNFYFADDSLVKMYNSLSPNDKIIFNCDIETISWRNYCAKWVIGIRKYIIKDGLKGTEYAIKKRFWLKIAFYITLFIYTYALWSILCMFINFGSMIFSLIV